MSDKIPSTEEKQHDPYVAGLIAQLGADAEKILAPEPEAKETITEGFVVMPEPVGTVRAKPAVTPEPTEEEKAADKAEEDKKNADEAAAAAAAKATTTDTRPVIKIVKREATVPQAPVVPAVPAKPEPTAAELEEAEYIESLTPEQQEELKVARYAEKNGRKGLAKETLDYFRKVDKYIADNPNPDTEEFDKFCNENKPKLSPLEMRKAERAMLVEEAEQRAEAKAQQIAAPVEREVRAIRMQPVIEKTLAEVEAGLTTANPENKDVEVFPKEVLEKLKTDGYEKALEEYPEEAPIVQGALAASREWLRIRNNLVDFSEANPVHSFLVNFLVQEGQRMMQRPESERMRGGKTFVPFNVMATLQRDNPEQAAKHYTFTDADVVDLIKNKALADHTHKIKALTRAGWKREPKQISATPGTETAKAAPVPPDGAGSPKAGARSVAGTTEATPDVAKLESQHPHLRGIGRLMGSGA